MKKMSFAVILLLANIAGAAERGGESPQAVANRFQKAFSQKNIEELSACITERERVYLLAANLLAAIEISTVLEGVDENVISSDSFKVDDLPQDTEKRRELVNLVKRNGIKLGGPSKPVEDLDPIKHFTSIAGPNPDRSIAELDVYNRRYLGELNPTDQVFQIFPEPEFSNFEISGYTGTVRMGETTATLVFKEERWFLSDFIVVGFELENEPQD